MAKKQSISCYSKGKLKFCFLLSWYSGEALSEQFILYHKLYVIFQK